LRGQSRAHNIEIGAGIENEVASPLVVDGNRDNQFVTKDVCPGETLHLGRNIPVHGPVIRITVSRRKFGQQAELQLPILKIQCHKKLAEYIWSDKSCHISDVILA